jgi:SagB-type dehydrogenase family enzyme
MTESIGREFIRKTCYPHVPESAQRKGLPQPPLELAYPPTAKLIDLPDPAEFTIPTLDLRAAIERRITMRSYSPQPLSLQELSFLLWCTQGVKAVTERPVTFRTVPSAGARHAFETYLLVNRVEGIEPGLYRFVAVEHALLPLDAPADIAERITQACLNQTQVRTSAVTFIWAAVTERMTWRYPERGYRYLLLDAGHVGQNLYLAAEAIDCGVCAIAAYDDDLVNTELGLDGDDLFAIYIGSVGKAKK